MPAGISTQPLISSVSPPPEGPQPGCTQGARVIAITSGKGGVGKTNITTNLGISLAAQGKKVCIFDADTSLANINILLGLTPTYTLEHLLNGEKAIQDILLPGPGGLHIIPAASGIVELISLDKTQQQRLLAGIKQLESQFDYLLIDTAAGISESLLSFLQAAPYTIVTITPEPTSLTDAFSLLKVLKNRGYNQSLLVIVNMAAGLDSAHSTYKRFRDAVAKYLHLKVFYLGYILSDTALTRAVIKQKPVVLQHPFSLASRCFQSLGDRLEKALQSREEDMSFSSFWDELPPPAGHEAKPANRDEGRDRAPTDTTEADTVLEMARGYLLAEGICAEEAEALLLKLAEDWMGRFGRSPHRLREAITPATAQDIPPTSNGKSGRDNETDPPNRSEHEVMGLRQARHYAHLLARSERRQ
jgi:MinD-like ATPase involved in chromosome partitioning or flagellar assembly